MLKPKALLISMLVVTAMFVLYIAFGVNNPETPPEQSPGQLQNDVTDLNWQVPAFQAVDQINKPVTLDTVKGQVWLTHVLFTRCPDICPPMTANMAKVQQALTNENIPVKIISFTIDPEHDTPEVLKTFGEKYGVDFTNWHFVSGYTFQDIQQLVKQAFKGQVSQVTSSDPNRVLFNHPSQFYLIDQTGKVRKFYDGIKPDVKQITADVKEIVAEGK
jgi:protein SCO1/2